MTQSFDEWYFKQRYLGIEPIDHARAAFKAGAQSKQAEIDELKMSNHYLSVQVIDAEAYSEHWKYERDKLQKRIDDALKAMEAESENSWGLWKEKADMYEQGASNAYEKSYWILKGTTNEQ